MNTVDESWGVTRCVFRRILRAMCLSMAALGLLVLQGCAAGPNANSRDPWEPFNRHVATFNDGLDQAVLKPVATAYVEVTPQLLRTGVNNFFGNLSDAWSFVNNVLQLKPRESAETLVRVGVNTVVGLGGLIDVATDLNIPRHREDFGQTLGHWGMPSGPYLVLPLLGPSTLRDSLALTVDVQGDLVAGLNEVPLRNTLMTMRIVDGRASVLKMGNLLEAAALDKYSFVRDAYLQRRRAQIGVESPPDQSAPVERFDLPETSSPPPVPATP